ncbi:MAG: lysophospholipase [bacterium]
MEGSFEGAGGVAISYRSWPAQGQARGVVVISHGGGEHSGRYEHVATRLCAEGYAAFALDHRGHGRSGGARMRFDSIEPLAADLGTMVEIARAEHPGAPCFLLAHSMGAAIGLTYAFEGQASLDGMILSSALAKLDTQGLQRAAARVIARVLPGVGVYRVDPEAVSRDPEVVRAYATDPLNHHGQFPAATIVALDQAVYTFPDRLPELRVPLLVMHGAEDRLTTPRGSELVDELAGSEDKTLLLYQGLYHEILNEPEQDRVLDEIAAWLGSHS